MTNFKIQIMKYSRKTFLRNIGLLTAGLHSVTWGKSGKPSTEKVQIDHGLILGLASYTLRELDTDTAIEIASRLQLSHLAFKSMHMPLASDKNALVEIREKVEKAGIKLYGAGVIYMESEEEVHQAFSYGLAARLEVIIGVPNHELLPLVEKKVQETNIKLAIHNHGPGDLLYSSVDDIHEKIKHLDPRVGFCIDVGHVVRINEDPVEKILRYRDRLYDVHLKDVSEASADGESVEFGRGVVDLPFILQALAEINYTGVMAIEFEKDAQDPVPGLAESVGYSRGLLASMRI